jgi:membrane-associated phospholipid phosphatase
MPAPFSALRLRRRRPRYRAPLVALVPPAIALARSRRAFGLPQPLSMLVAAAVPAAVAAAAPPSRLRHAATWAAHMWAYGVNFAVPYDRPEALERRLIVDAALRVDARLGGGVPPTERLQRALRRPPRLTPLDWSLTGVYVLWEAEPHVMLIWLILRHPERFPAAAARLAAAYDLTLPAYWIIPSAPPWWASEHAGRMERAVRRVTVEVGRALRGRPRPLDEHSLGDNPWAAMPSDHLATAAMTALLAGEVHRGAGAVAWAYAAALAFALVYMGEHYVTDLIAGLALALGVHRVAPVAAGPARRARRAWARLEP